MFEKSLYDLIRGLRNHKGNEREYIQHSIRECRQEIKSQDIELKATALLKLTYLEMFGHDMSWASFNVLEVMSTPNFNQKRVGYLSAIQSFRSDTEVAMLVENLLKKDLASTNVPVIALALTAIPHVISASMANSLLGDLLPRLTHSNPAIRKKTVITLYRLALAYPETLRPAWPRIKERLVDEEEDPSVTAAVVNVVCELGWRRPQDFLPLAPRLFELLIGKENNWMAIKIIKLFATLTPLEPRLVKKLLPPLTTIIKTTPAMSLLYECVNGIIQGGILEASSGTTEGDEIARLCVGKLRSMLVVEGDPNLKYVALLAFGKIVESHPFLVSMHEDVVLECIDDQDTSIRLRALDLVVGMVNASNLVPVVDRLLEQLRDSPFASSVDDPSNDRGNPSGIVPQADMDEEDATDRMRSDDWKGSSPPLPDDYRIDVITRILDMCSQDTYANINDFDWYLETLVSLVRQVPSSLNHETSQVPERISLRIGSEIRNIAVRVKSARAEAVNAADSIVSVDQRDQVMGKSTRRPTSVLEATAFVVGEYATYLRDPDRTLDSLIHADSALMPASILKSHIQASLKLFSFIVNFNHSTWTAESQSSTALLAAKIAHFLELLVNHSSLEIQELSVQYLELLRLVTEAIKAHPISQDGQYQDPPLLLTQAIPALFTGGELNPVSKDAQHKIPPPDDIDFDAPINDSLNELLSVPAFDLVDEGDDEMHQYYHQRPRTKIIIEPAAKRLDAAAESSYSYQQSAESYLDPDVSAKRRAERRERNRDDPFYIPSENGSRIATPTQDALRVANGDELDVDSIPIMALDLGDDKDHAMSREASYRNKQKIPIARRNFDILADETVGDSNESKATAPLKVSPASRSLLQVDSSGLGALSLEEASRQRGGRTKQLDIERQQAEEAEMAQAMQEVERLRLEMQRAQERITAKTETLLSSGPTKKKKKKTKVAVIDGVGPSTVTEADAPKTKKKKKKVKEPAGTEGEVLEPAQQQPVQAEGSVPKKKKPKRRVATVD